jgi:hypothetical protein
MRSGKVPAAFVSTIPGAEPPPSSKIILDEANKIIHSDRAASYGPVEDSFERIAKYWEDYLGIAIDREDVAMMMILLKVARNQHSFKRDNLIDIAGYAALAEKCNVADIC